MLVDRTATWNTNADPSQWLQLAGRERFCEFEMGQGDETTRISVDLVTLYAEEPTLASVAYLSKVSRRPPAAERQSGDVQLPRGAGRHGDVRQRRGRRRLGRRQPAGVRGHGPVRVRGHVGDRRVRLLYHADGTIRGADLATKMRYQPGGKLPAIFGN